MKELFLVLLCLLCVAVCVTCVIMFVSAIQFGEMGRVVFYLMLGMLAVSIGVWTIFKIKDLPKE